MSQHRIDKEIPLPAQIKDVLGILDESGFFEDGLLVGSWVFPFYKEVFGIEYVLRTDDVDFALVPDVMKSSQRMDLEAAFMSKGYDVVMDNLSGLQKFLAGTFDIEFLIHRRGGREETVTISKYNVHAQPLPFLDLLFIAPMDIRLPEFRVRIPSPEALFLHKLIIAQRRKKDSKQDKDLEQCEILVPHMDSDKLTRILQDYRMSKATIQSIKRSCDVINIQADFL